MAFDPPADAWHLPDYSWPLPASMKIRLGQHSLGRQRVMLEEGHLLLVLHRPPRHKRWGREGHLVLRLPNGVWMADGHDNGLLALTRLFQEYDDMLKGILAEYDRAAQALDHLAILHQVVPLVRSADYLRQTLQTAREAVREDRDLIGFRDRADALWRTLSLLREDCQFSLEAIHAASSEAEVVESKAARQTQRKLNLLAAMTFPLMAIAAVFGMNLHSGLSSESVLLFWLVLFAGVGTGIGLARWAR